MAGRYEKRILRVIRYIYDNPDGDLSLDMLADVAAMSRFHWHRVYQAITGETCAEAVRRIRLHRAACLLTQKNTPLDQIAKAVGYPNMQSFSRCFRTAYGTSPGQFRKVDSSALFGAKIQKGNSEMYNVEIKKMPKRRLAVLEHKGPYIEIGKCFEELSAIASSRNLWPTVKGMAGIYFDDPNSIEESKLRSMAGLELGLQSLLPEGLVEFILPAGDHAVLRFQGSYSGLKNAYDYLYGDWLPDSGKEPADAPTYEIYLNSPADTKAEDLLTEICLPIAS